MVNQYVFWLAVISLACLVAERVRPWRKEQRALRPQLGQDVFWLVFNGYVWGLVSVPLFVWIYGGLEWNLRLVTGRASHAFAFLSGRPFWVHVLVYLVLADFMEWCVHNLLHRFDVLWRFHRMHHSIKYMDWIGNFRFHWGEVIVYKTVKYLPLAVLGARGDAVLTAAVVATLIGHLNHSNLNISWGPLRYVLNSPRMHIWHHDKKLRGKAGVNFGVVFSIWDWVFKTAYMPDGQPAELGFGGEAKVPSNPVVRFFVPFLDFKPKK